MSFWELFTALASAASIVSFAIALSSIFNGRATRRVVREMTSETQTLIRSTQEATRTLLQEMQSETQTLIRSTHDDTRTLLQEMQSETRALFERMDARAERMDQRADERHREVLQTIQTLRA